MNNIEKIKAEIERRKRELDEQIVDIQDSKAALRKDELQRLLSFLSTLESEKPMNQDESLNEEIKKEMANLPFFIRGKDQIAFARHFAQWGAEHLKETEL